MSTNAVVSQGTVFKRGDGTSNETFTAISEINSVSLPSRSRPTIDVTDLDSVVREFLVGIRDNGQVTLSMNFTRDTYIDMNTDFENTSSVNYQIVFPDTNNTTMDLAMYVINLDGDVPGPDEKITSNVTFKISGDFTITS